MRTEVPEFLTCPRCGDENYEYLETYSHCVSCFYSPEFDVPYDQIPKEALDEIRELSQSDAIASTERPKRESAPVAVNAPKRTLSLWTATRGPSAENMQSGHTEAENTNTRQLEAVAAL